MRELSDGHWRPFEPGGAPHRCDSRTAVRHRLRPPAYDLAEVDGIAQHDCRTPGVRRGGTESGGAPKVDGLVLVPSVLPDPARDPLFDSLARQLDDRRWRCPRCRESVQPHVCRGGLVLRCVGSTCGRHHSISDTTLNATLREVGARCDRCGSLCIVRRTRRGSVVGCSRFPECNRADTWEVVHARLCRFTTGRAHQFGPTVPHVTVKALKHVEGNPERLAAPVEQGLQQLMDTILRRLRTDRVQNHGFRVLVEVRDGDLGCGWHVATIPEDGTISCGLGDGFVTVCFDRTCTEETIRRVIITRFAAVSEE